MAAQLCGFAAQAVVRPPQCQAHPPCSCFQPRQGRSRAATFTSAASRHLVATRAKYQDELEQELEEDVARRKQMSEDSEEGVEAQLQALREQGPPPGMSREQFNRDFAAYEQAMRNPEQRAQIMEAQNASNNPQSQQAMQEMQAVMSNPQLMQRMQDLKEDPDMAGFFQDLQKGGMAAMSKYMADTEFLQKLSSKLGDVDMGDVMKGGPASAAGPTAAAAAAAPDIENLLQAAKHGDVEAAEDFIAIGHDVNAVDGEGRSPLHYAVAYRHMEVARNLLGAQCNLEATDSKGNTPLHYAAGYGRGEFVKLLLEAGANGKAVNEASHTPLVLLTAEPRNPLNNEADVVEQLKAAAGM